MPSVLVTGSARGLGYEFAKQFAEQGYRVYATCRDRHKADKLTTIADRSEGLLTVHEMDIGDEASVRACAASIGDVPIDILLNNAGVWGGLETQVLANMDYDNWAHELNIMLMGPFRVVQAFLDNVIASDEKKIVTVSSQTAAHSYDHVVGYSYASAKAGLNRIMTALANELEDKGVTVALLHPGWVKTEMAGDVADLEPDYAAAKILDVIKGMTQANSGQFLQWKGGVHPW